MGTQKSHFAYRLAWANTSSERIPFLPLHRRDLVFAEEGNQTYIGGDTDCINWKKFDIMGDVIVGIQKSQSTPYQNISRNEGVQRLVLDGKFTKDDDVSDVIDLHVDDHIIWKIKISFALHSAMSHGFSNFDDSYD